MNAEVLLAHCDCAILTSPASLLYFSGFDQSDAVIVVTPRERFFLTDSRYEVFLKTALLGDWSVRILSRSEQLAFLREVVASADRVGLEYDHVTLAAVSQLIGTDDLDKTVDLSPLIFGMRLVKRADEIEVIKRAEAMVDEVYAEVLPLLRVGVTEQEISAEITMRLMRRGATGNSFDPIVAFGENAAMPHAVPSDRTLKKGDCVLMDFGAKYRGYCSDFTRTVFCGEPTERFRSAYAFVLEAQRAAIRYLEQGGRNAAEADAAARRVIDDSPFRGAFNHSLGHGVGVEIHEGPTLSCRSTARLSDGMVFTLEPGIYVEGEFGVRIESLVLIENGKLTVIDRSDKEIYTV